MATDQDPDIRRLAWEVAALKETVARISSLKLDVLVERQLEMADDLKSLRRVVIQVGVGIVSASIVFALTVFSLLGQH